MINNRLNGLDYLRGMAAFCIMIYHYFTWTLGRFDSSTFLGKVGTYGVSIFYILSGITLYHVYKNGLTNQIGFWIVFFKKRILRIYPLMWLVIFSSIILYSNSINLIDIFLNLTGLFGFVKWDTYLATGLWSIGNELVFYSLFPLLILSLKFNKFLFYGIGFVFFVIYLYFAFYAFNGENNWRNYVNPLNQVFLFYSGVFVGYLFGNLSIKNNYLIITLIASFVLFAFAPVYGELNVIYSSFWRMYFTLLSILFCFTFYKYSFGVTYLPHRVLGYFGEISYGIYLIHPIAYELSGIFNQSLVRHGFETRELFRLILAFLLTIGFSTISYKYIEKYFISLGKKSSHA